MSTPSDEIHKDLLNIQEKSSMIYSTFLQNRYVSKTDTISSTMSKSGRYKLNTINDLGHCKKSKVAGKNDLSKSLATAQKRVDSTSQSLRSRETPEVRIDSPIVPFEENQLITKPIKRILVQEKQRYPFNQD